MSQFLKGFNTTIFSLLMASITFVVLNQFPQIWYPWVSQVEYAVLVMLCISAIFAAQFNHSRLTLLSLLFLFYSLSKTFTLPWSAWIAEQQTWFVLQNIFMLGGLALIKDRGLISIHGLYRILFVCSSAIIAYLWQIFAVWVIDSYGALNSGGEFSVKPWLGLLLVELPAALVVFTLFWKSFTQISSLSAALLVTSLYFIGDYYQHINIAWQVCYLAFAFYYLLVVVVDSYFLAYRDDLTTLPSRRALNQLALSLGRKYTVAMLDIDHFKKFNDSYGHDIGDQVLKLVAARIKEVKSGGKAFRYGGEEFTIVFPRKNIAQVLSALEEVRQTIADYEVVIRHPLRGTKQARHKSKTSDTKKVNVTISIGVASRESKQGFEQVLKVADQALYRAKKKGRNNVSQ